MCKKNDAKITGFYTREGSFKSLKNFFWKKKPFGLTFAYDILCAELF